MNSRSAPQQIHSEIHHIASSHFSRSVQIQSSIPESVQIRCYRPEFVMFNTSILIIDTSETSFPGSPHSESTRCAGRARADPEPRHSIPASTRIVAFSGREDQDHAISWQRRPGSAPGPGGGRAGPRYRPKSDRGRSVPWQLLMSGPQWCSVVPRLPARS